MWSTKPERQCHLVIKSIIPWHDLRITIAIQIDAVTRVDTFIVAAIFSILVISHVKIFLCSEQCFCTSIPDVLVTNRTPNKTNPIVFPRFGPIKLPGVFQQIGTQDRYGPDEATRVHCITGSRYLFDGASITRTTNVFRWSSNRPSP